MAEVSCTEICSTRLPRPVHDPAFTAPRALQRVKAERVLLRGSMSAKCAAHVAVVIFGKTGLQFLWNLLGPYAHTVMLPIVIFFLIIR